jgi:hypothetical protein
MHGTNQLIEPVSTELIRQDRDDFDKNDTKHTRDSFPNCTKRSECYLLVADN